MVREDLNAKEEDAGERKEVDLSATFANRLCVLCV
jgi:hypothetical protein